VRAFYSGAYQRDGRLGGSLPPIARPVDAGNDSCGLYELGVDGSLFAARLDQTLSRFS